MNAHIDTDIAVIGASLGGVLAAWQAASAGSAVVLTAEFDWIGGQLTSQGVPPDEHRLIEHGGASRSYLAMRAALRRHYLDQPGFVDNSIMTELCNPGDGWVSRLCVEPAVAASYLEGLLAPLVAQGMLRIVRGVRLAGASCAPDDGAGKRIAAVTLRGADGALTTIAARWFLDATDTGALIAAAGLPSRLGKEARAEFGEADAPEEADRMDQQPVTMVMALRRDDAGAATTADAPPHYDFWRRHVLPHYGYLQLGLDIPGAGRGERVRLPLFGSGQVLDLWRYRRVVSAANWRHRRAEVSLVNWAQNDYGLHPLLEGEMAEDDVVAAAAALSLCVLHWLRTDAPWPDGSGAGYPGLQLAPESLGTASGLAQQVYVRESRRIVGLDCLSQADIAVGPGLPASQAAAREDSVGVAWYNMDIHPTVVSGHGVNAHVRPFTLPLGSFIARDCVNLIPACKNISVTHLVNACTRVHPAEWLIGEVAGLLAVFAERRGVALADIHADAALRRAFQHSLDDAGIVRQWDAALLARLAPSASPNPA
jgi:hypothetical protein